MILADQITKAWAAARSTSATDAVGHLGPLRSELVRNSGAAFGLGRSLTLWITLLALTAATAFATAGRRTQRPAWAAAYGLLVGGTAGNAIDRLSRSPGPLHGAVVDWIKLPFYGPVFNLADVAVRTGALLAIVLLLRRHHTSPDIKPDTASATS